MSMDVGGNKPGAVKSDINVTPLVDVMLVLLIIFMVVTPMLQKGQAVVLPVAGNPDKKPEEKGEILVAVTAERQGANWALESVWIDKKECTPTEFPTKIKEEFDRNPGGTLLIKADAHLTYGDVKKVMLQVGDAGFKKVGLVAQKKDKSS
jgi:biopolymer transport protein ExbD